MPNLEENEENLVFTHLKSVHTLLFLREIKENYELYLWLCCLYIYIYITGIGKHWDLKPTSDLESETLTLRHGSLYLLDHILVKTDF